MISAPILRAASPAHVVPGVDVLRQPGATNSTALEFLLRNPHQREDNAVVMQCELDKTGVCVFCQLNVAGVRRKGDLKYCQGIIPMSGIS